MQFFPNPAAEFGAFRFARLVLFFRRHLLEIDLLQRAVHEVEPRLQGDLVEVIESDITFFRAIFVAFDAILFQQRRGLFRHLERSRCGR